jgi:hypothetical protein
VDNTSNTRKEEALEYTKEMIEAEEARKVYLQLGYNRSGLSSEDAMRRVIKSLMIASHAGRIGNVPS